jgi:hypothetical protein
MPSESPSPFIHHMTASTRFHRLLVISGNRILISLIEEKVAPAPVLHKDDRSRLKGYVTLLSRPDLLWLYELIWAESVHAPTNVQFNQVQRRCDIPGPLTKATLAKLIAAGSHGGSPAAPTRQQQGEAERFVDACHAFGLVEYTERPNRQLKPFRGTKRLADLLAEYEELLEEAFADMALQRSSGSGFAG